MNSNITQLFKLNFALWGIIAFVILAILPIAFELREPYQKICISIGVSIFTSLTVTYFVNKIISGTTSDEIKSLITEKFPKLLEMEKMGLEKVIYHNKMETIIDLVSSQNLYIVMNDGKNFFTNNSYELAERFKQENKNTYIILLSDNSESANMLNVKHEHNEASNYYQTKIQEAIKEYQKLHKTAPTSNNLEIYQFQYNFMTSIVANDEIAVIGTYRNFAGKGNPPPHFIFKNLGNECEYKSIKQDIESLKKNSVRKN